MDRVTGQRSFLSCAPLQIPSQHEGCASTSLDDGFQIKLTFITASEDCRCVPFHPLVVDAQGIFKNLDAVRESVNKSAASAASLDYVKFQAVIKSAASAASLRRGRASGRLDHGFFLQLLAALAAKKYSKSRTLLESSAGRLFSRKYGPPLGLGPRPGPVWNQELRSSVL